uniref:Uncharacterized protein n=1 Tax=viral metagenome TaxID=1070528 RepID=A0A6C0HI49_9ZZZZ
MSVTNNNLITPNNIFQLENAVMADLTEFNKQYRLYLTCGNTGNTNQQYFDKSICNGDTNRSITPLNDAYSKLVNSQGTGSLNILNAAISNLNTTTGGIDQNQYLQNYNDILTKYNMIVRQRQSLDAKLSELYEIGDTSSNFYQKKLVSTSYTKILLSVLATGLVVTAFIVSRKN